MASFLSSLFGNKKDARPSEVAGLQQLSPESREESGRREPPAQLDWSRAEYIPMPPSPPTWEVDGRDEFHREYNDPTIGPVFDAGFNNQHTKVLRLAASLSAEQRQGSVGDVIAKAYRKQIIQRMKAGQLAAAAKQCDEMLKMVPMHVRDVDRRRFNRILKQMDKEGKKHNYTPADVASTSSQPLFTVADGHGWVVSGERKLEGEQRPNPAFEVAAMDRSGSWLLDRSGASVGRPEAKSVLRRLDLLGRTVGEKPLSHDVYRTGAGSAGSHIAIMDSTGILHIYDSGLNVVAEANLQGGSTRSGPLPDHRHRLLGRVQDAGSSRGRCVRRGPIRLHARG